MTRLFPALLGLSFLSLLPQQLRAAEGEVYGGIGLGYSTFKIDSVNFEGSSYATRQFLGLRYGDYLALEAGYINFGKVKDRVVVQDGQPSLVQSVQTSGYNVSLVGRYPLDEELAAFGKLGMIKWDTETTLSTFDLAEKTSGNDLIWGLGLDYRGSGRIHVRVEAEFVDIPFANSWWVLTTSVMYGIPFAR
jgi:OOP family OmpA-OmpF porin